MNGIISLISELFLLLLFVCKRSINFSELFFIQFLLLQMFSVVGIEDIVKYIQTQLALTSDVFILWILGIENKPQSSFTHVLFY